MIKSWTKSEQFGVKAGIILAKLGIPPNIWTISALIPALIGFYFLSRQDLLLGGIFFAISALVDGIDGAVARVTNSVSNLGAFLDGIIDRYVEIVLYLGLYMFLQDKYFFLLPASIWIMLFDTP